MLINQFGNYSVPKLQSNFTVYSTQFNSSIKQNKGSLLLSMDSLCLSSCFWLDMTFMSWLVGKLWNFLVLAEIVASPCWYTSLTKYHHDQGQDERAANISKPGYVLVSRFCLWAHLIINSGHKHNEKGCDMRLWIQGVALVARLGSERTWTTSKSSIVAGARAPPWGGDSQKREACKDGIMDVADAVGPFGCHKQFPKLT